MSLRPPKALSKRHMSRAGKPSPVQLTRGLHAPLGAFRRQAISFVASCCCGHAVRFCNGLSAILQRIVPYFARITKKRQSRNSWHGPHNEARAISTKPPLHMIRQAPPKIMACGCLKQMRTDFRGIIVIVSLFLGTATTFFQLMTYMHSTIGTMSRGHNDPKSAAIFLFEQGNQQHLGWVLAKYDCLFHCWRGHFLLAHGGGFEAGLCCLGSV